MIRLTLLVIGGLAESFTAETGKKNWIPVVDLPTGHGKIEIAAATETESGTVNVARSWTYTKTAQAFGDAGGVADLSLNGQTVWPKTIPEAVRTPGVWGGNLGTALNLLQKAALYHWDQHPKYMKIKVDLSKVKEGDVVNLPEGGVMVPFHVAKIDYESGLNGAGRTLLVRKYIYDKRQWHDTFDTANAWDHSRNHRRHSLFQGQLPAVHLHRGSIDRGLPLDRGGHDSGLADHRGEVSGAGRHRQRLRQQHHRCLDEWGL